MNRPIASLRYALPSLLTGVSLMLALFSMVSAELGALERAAWLIVWCVLLDIADGIVARWLHATSKFGAELDSLTDLVAFGIAPATLVLHFVWQRHEVDTSWWTAAACGSYALFAALRLARFNAFVAARPGWFQGVPTTACGALIATGMILLVRYDSEFGAVDWRLWLTLSITVLGFSMVSNLRFPKLALTSSRLLNIPHVANIAGYYICGALGVWPEYLFGTTVVFMLAGLIVGLARSPDDTT